MTPNEITERLAALEAQAASDRAQTQTDRAALTRTRRQLRVTWAVSLLAALVTFALGYHKDALAQGYGITLAQAATRIAALETKTAALETKTAALSTLTDPNTSQPTVRFTGVNVQVVSGSGKTEATANGTGNLIIGYNEFRPFGGATNFRTGSHNLVVGYFHNYSSSGGTVLGRLNTISGLGACVVGGDGNTASAQFACVSGGGGNTASGLDSSVSGGLDNTASGVASSVSGGELSTASGFGSTVLGGYYLHQPRMDAFSAGGTYSESNPGVGIYHFP